MALQELAGVGIALVGTALAAYQDALTSFIDERLTYGMIAAGALVVLSTLDQQLIIGAFAGAAVIFAIGYALYRAGQVGGGDVLLFTAIQLLVPVRPAQLGIPLFNLVFDKMALDQVIAYGRVLQAIPFFASVFAAASFFALLGSAIFYASKIAKARPKPELVPGGITSTASLVFLWWLYSRGVSVVQTAFFGLVLAAACFLIAFKKQIMNEVVVQNIAIEEVEDEDILVTSKMDEKIVEKYSLGKVLTKEEVEKLKKVREKEGIKLFPVAKVLPRLGPYILLGLITSLLLGDLFAFFLVLK